MLRLIVEQEAAALERLRPEVAAYFATGSFEELSLSEATEAWEEIRFAPRVLRNVATVSTATTLLGSRLAAPILSAPTAFHCLAHERAEAETADGLARANSLMVVSTRSTTRFEELTETGCPWWFQIYVLAERSLTEGLIGRAAKAGATALVLTGDTPVVAPKRRAGLTVPVDDDLFLRQLEPDLPAGSVPGPAVVQSPSVTFADIAWLKEVSGLPVLVKGVLRADDARSCLEAGADGVIVSNHGGRQLDRAVASAHALGPIARAVGERGLVLVDGGLRDGRSILAALALGAHGVLVGRPVLHALAAGGSPAVAALIEALQRDLALAMALCGASGLAELDASVLAAPGAPPPRGELQ